MLPLFAALLSGLVVGLVVFAINFGNDLAKLDIDIISIALGKESVDHVHYCEIDFHSTEANIYQLQGKIEKKVRVINLVRTDDAYKRD